MRVGSQSSNARRKFSRLFRIVDQERGLTFEHQPLNSSPSSWQHAPLLIEQSSTVSPAHQQRRVTITHVPFQRLSLSSLEE
jgi:hypothetical protein